MDNTESNAWVFDSLVGFLHGPVWNVPLQTFIEEKSLPFEPTDDGEVLDRPEYKKVHQEYKNLVDVMLGSFMDDIGITTEQFEAACRISARDLAGLPAHFHRRLFEQIWAANDYDIFAKMMTHKNVELQLQALELIERRFGMLPSLFSQDVDGSAYGSKDRGDEGDWSDVDDVMTEVKKLQLEDTSVKETLEVPPEDVVAEKKNLISKLHSFEKDPPIENSNTSAKIKPSLPPSEIPSPKKVKVTEEEVHARQEYLKQQRDKLLALKKQVREKRLDDDQDEGASSRPARPKSAKVAQAALAGVTPTPAPDAMQLRRALASRLRNEVVDTAL